MENATTRWTVWLVLAAGFSQITLAQPTIAQLNDAEEDLFHECPEAISLLEDGQLGNALELVTSNPDEASRRAERLLCLAAAIWKEEEQKTWPSRSRMRHVERLCGSALEAKPELVAAKLLRSRALERLGVRGGAYEEVQDVFSTLAGVDETEDGWSEISRIRRELASRQRDCAPWVLRLDFGLGYDSNVPQVGSDAGAAWWRGRRRDWRIGAGARFVGRVCDDDRNELYAGLSAWSTWQADLDSFDEQRYGGSLRFVHRLNEYVELGIDYSYRINLLGRDRYFSSHKVSPSVVVFGDSRWRTIVYYEFEPRQFFDVTSAELEPLFDRSGATHAVGIEHRHQLVRLPSGVLSMDLGFRHEDVGTKGTEYDARNEIVFAFLDIPITRDLWCELGGTWIWEDYRNANGCDRRERSRRDFVQTYSASLVFRLSDNVRLHTGASWTDDDSNILGEDRESPFSFRRTIVGASLIVELRPVVR